MINNKFPFVWYGGDYNPDQWSKEIQKEDMRLFKKAKINIVTLPVFSWAKLQPSEDNYDFKWLDEIIEMVKENGMKVCLATPTAAQPAWMSKRYPDVLPVDEEGRKKTHGGRVNYCPNSKTYKKYSVKIAEEMAKRYHDNDVIAAWHISNEYLRYCYCENCAEEFRRWLKDKYKTIEELNRAWNMSFWGHTVYDWDEIVPPSELNGDVKFFQGMSLDYNRFMSESNLELFKGEYDAIRKYSKDIPITTNLMGTFKPFDYFKWAKHMDVVSWDSYPRLTDDMNTIAMRHDLMRGIKNGKPFMLMEQTPSQQNWQTYNSLKRPGVMRLWSYQAMAHGADTIMFFQLRRSQGACEKYHGAVISHAGHENTRVFRECAKLGMELEGLKDTLLDSRVEARAAIIFDWDNWWACELSSGPTEQLDYIEQIDKYHKAFYKQNIAVDMVQPNSDLSKYDIVVAPVLYMVKGNDNENIENYVKAGGTFITTFFSGIVDENDLVTIGGYPGKLRKLLGIWVEEIDALYPEARNSINMIDPKPEMQGTYECKMLCDIIHTEGAKEIAKYGKDFYANTPVITENKFGEGKACYIGTDPEQQFVDDYIKRLCKEKGLECEYVAVEGVEIVKRAKDNKVFTFFLNHNDTSAAVEINKMGLKDIITGKEIDKTIKLDAKDVIIIEEER